ncbi:MAG: hypothetical protein CMK59_01285 [Proteobacteria bacterium]|nr:hypothetical protein [Pseudomonadota bacterium]
MNNFMIALFILTSCNSENPPPQKTQILTSTKHAAAKKSDFDNYAFHCCSEKTLNSALNSYLKLVQAMGDDDEQKSLASFSDLSTSIEQLQIPEKDNLISEFSKINSDSLTSLRDSFSLFSSAFIKVVQLQKANDLQTETTSKEPKPSTKQLKKISVAFCPMAPGRWLQTSNIIHNPYFGSEMLTCGVFEQ